MPHAIENLTDYFGNIKITATAHGLTSGALVTIAGVTAPTGINHSWTIMVFDANNFLLNGSTFGTWSNNGTWDAGGGGGGGAISGVSNTAPIIITTTAPHGLVSGAAVNIAGVGGNVAANNLWMVNVLNSTSFELRGSDGTNSGTYTSGGTITAVAPTFIISDVSSTTPMVVTTTAPHGLINNQSIQIQITNVKGITIANGIWNYTVIDATHFSLDNSFVTDDTPEYEAFAYFQALPSVTLAAPCCGPQILAASIATPIVITAKAHGLTTGMKVTISDVIGNIAANGTWSVTVLTVDTFSLDTSVGNAATPYMGGGTYQVIPHVDPQQMTQVTATTPIVVTCVGHGLNTGDSVIINQAPGTLVTAVGQWVITKLTNDTFSLNGSAAAGAGQDYNNPFLSGGGGTFVTVPGVTVFVTSQTGSTGIGGISVDQSFIIFPQDALIQYDINNGVVDGPDFQVYERGLATYDKINNQILRYPNWVDTQDDGLEESVDFDAGTKYITATLYFTGGPAGGTGPGNSQITMGGFFSGRTQLAVPATRSFVANGGIASESCPSVLIIGGTSDGEIFRHVIEEHAFNRSFWTNQETVNFNIDYADSMDNIMRTSPLRPILIRSRLTGQLSVRLLGNLDPIRTARLIEIIGLDGCTVIEQAEYLRLAQSATLEIPLIQQTSLLPVLTGPPGSLPGTTLLQRPIRIGGTQTLLTGPAARSVVYSGGTTVTRTIPNLSNGGLSPGAAIPIDYLTFQPISSTGTKVVMGRLQVTNRLAARPEHTFGLSSKLFYVPMYMQDPGHARITLAVNNAAAPMTPQWWNAPIMGSDNSIPTLDLARGRTGSPVLFWWDSPTPFTPVLDSPGVPKLQVGNPQVGIPFDIFISMPKVCMQGGAPFLTSPASRKPVLFWINWRTATQRMTVLGGSTLGHNLVLYPDIGLTLKVAGENSIVEPELQRDYLYLYLGTAAIVDNNSFLVPSTVGARLLWNNYNRIRYAERMYDFSFFWPHNKNLRLGQYGAMSAARPDMWRWWYINPVSAEGIGNYPTENRPGDVPGANGQRGIAVNVICSGPLGIGLFHKNGTLLASDPGVPATTPAVTIGGGVIRGNRAFTTLKIPTNVPVPLPSMSNFPGFILPHTMVGAGNPCGINYLEVKSVYNGFPGATQKDRESNWGFYGVTDNSGEIATAFGAITNGYRGQLGFVQRQVNPNDLFSLPCDPNLTLFSTNNLMASAAQCPYNFFIQTEV